jgi:UDP-2,3-diacylglucosamine pyrophosphatase LpxH
LRTLVISDLHLGIRQRHDVLRHDEPRERLLAALQDIDRLVLLGDIVELTQGRTGYVLSLAQPLLRQIARRMGPDREVILVPGNHDLPLIRRWVRAQGRRLTESSGVPNTATPALSRIVTALAPARVRVSYPGVWLEDRLWATHGHYLNRHLLPESAFGVGRGLLGRQPTGAAIPQDYERRPSLPTGSRYLPGPAAGMLGSLAGSLRAATMPAVRRNLLRRGFAPLTSTMLSLQMQRAAIPALTRVVHRLGVDAEWVVFGHVHRLGPLEADDLDEWQGPGGSPRVINTGSWLYEPRLVHGASPPHPYWPGGAVLLEPGRDPQPVGLLDDLSPAQLRGAPDRR